MEWTATQREAIEYRGENILLAAAAGSGKTAVLVQRIIEMIECDKVSVNELLVLTFTEAAAGEMREKIKKAITKALKENPEDEHLQRQKLLIHSASISTVHSFCLNLLKSNIHMTKLPVDFSLVSDLENTIILKEALEEVLERFYGNIDKDKSFADLVVGYGGIKNDKALRETVLSLHKFSKSMAYPSKWLNGAVRAYRDVSRTGSLEGQWWIKRLGELVEEARSEIFRVYEQILADVERKLGEGHPYKLFFEDEYVNIKRMFSHVDTHSYTSMKEAVESFAFGRLVTVRKTDGAYSPEQEKIKSLRELARDIMKDLCKCFVLDERTVVERITKSYPVVRTLKNIVLMLDRCYTRRKREKSLLDFGDLEHETVALLVSKSGEATEVAETLRKKYKAILVDEYQDTNNIQDLIFRTVSRENQNIFMVGDLKQGIYKFRNAVPKLFSDKYELYGKENGPGHLIRLFKNFRSRRNVVDTVNFVFRNIMSPEVGDIDYNSEEYLVQGAEYPELSDMSVFDTEFHMICCDSEDEEAEEAEKNVTEARVAAARIKQMVAEGVPAFDKELGKTRPISYRDFVVLMRKTKGVANIFEQVFDECGIPVYSDVGHKYLDALEVRTVLAFLQIVDNPRQDIPLIAVMRSPMWGFEPEELAQMRSEKKDGCFFEAVSSAAESGCIKAAEFLGELWKLREDAVHMGIDRLICRIYYDFGYYAYVGALDHGRERQANLRVLLERATEFEHTKMSGLFSFMNYVETMRSEGQDMTPAKAFGEGEDVVKIMSIHKSKGLEFPVVILVNTANKFNLSDTSNPVIWEEQGGIGLDCADTKMRIRYASLSKNLVGLKLRKDMLSEEMRLLYVALTRAREKLILTATFRSSEQKWKKAIWDEKGCVPAPCVRGIITYKEWLTAALMVHPSAAPLREYAGISDDIVAKDADFGLKVFLYENSERVPEIRELEIHKDESDVREESHGFGVKERLDFEYSRKELGRLPVKMSVSEVKRMRTDEAENVPLIESLRTLELANPGVVSGAEKGTVVHFVMQLANPVEINSVRDVEKLVERLVDEKIIEENQAEAVECEKIARFFLSPMGQRLKKALRCETEFSFYTVETADEIFGNGLKDEILLQGIIDCFFVEADGRVVLLDFKTDRAATARQARCIAEKYRVQMKYYKRALKDVLERDVDECYLYFLDCGELVPMEDEEV